MNLNLRKLKKSDLQTTFMWVNHEAIRKFSINTQEVSFNSHSNWFLQKLESIETAYYILENVEKVSLGSIRFDLQEETGKINYLVDPQYHGKGLGSILLEFGIRALKDDYPHITSVYGLVFHDNLASVRIFKKLKFSMSTEKNGFLKFEYRIREYGD